MTQVVGRFLAYYRPYKRLFALDFSCAVLAAALELSFPLFVNYVIDTLLPSLPARGPPGTRGGRVRVNRG